MGYRRPRRHDENHGIRSVIPVDNGTITHVMIPCFYEMDGHIYPHRVIHDHFGWPAPDAPDDSCQLPDVPDWMELPEPVDLEEEGYDAVQVSFVDQPDGLNVTGQIDDNIVRLTISANCESAQTECVDVRFAVYISGKAHDGDGDGIESPLSDLVCKGIIHIIAGPTTEGSEWVNPTVEERLKELIEERLEELISEVEAGVKLPIGGVSGQVLTKVTSKAHDVEWRNVEVAAPDISYSLERRGSDVVLVGADESESVVQASSVSAKVGVEDQTAGNVRLIGGTGISLSTDGDDDNRDVTISLGELDPNLGYYHDSGTYSITTASIDSHLNGPRITVPAGTYVFVASWVFQTGVTTGPRNLEIGFRSGANGSFWGERERIYSAGNHYAVLNISAIRSFDEETTVYLAASSSMKTKSADHAWITALKLR